MNDLGRMLVSIGLLLVIAGGTILLLAKGGIPFGRLPGDIVYRGRHFSFYFPLGICIVLSVAVSIIFYLLSHLRR